MNRFSFLVVFAVTFVRYMIEKSSEQTFEKKNDHEVLQGQFLKKKRISMVMNTFIENKF